MIICKTSLVIIFIRISDQQQKNELIIGENYISVIPERTTKIPRFSC